MLGGSGQGWDLHLEVKTSLEDRTQAKLSHEITCYHPLNYVPGLTLFHKILPQMHKVQYEEISLILDASVTKVLPHNGTHMSAEVSGSFTIQIRLSQTLYSILCGSLKSPQDFCKFSEVASESKLLLKYVQWTGYPTNLGLLYSTRAKWETQLFPSTLMIIVLICIETPFKNGIWSVDGAEAVSIVGT